MVLQRGRQSSWRLSAPTFLGTVIFFAFTLAQLADGLFTYVGITAFGINIEANPIIAWYAATFGVGVALVGAKTVALLCATALHLTGRHYVIGVLTIGYAVGALWPWTKVLWP
jgi:hypothetical protein